MKDNIIWRKSHFFNSTMEASAELNHAAEYLKSHVKEISLSEIQKENYATLFESAAEIIEDQNNTIAGLEATIQMRDETIDVLEEQIGELNYFIKDLSETLEPIYQNSGMSGSDAVPCRCCGSWVRSRGTQHPETGSRSSPAGQSPLLRRGLLPQIPEPPERDSSEAGETLSGRCSWKRTRELL